MEYGLDLLLDGLESKLNSQQALGVRWIGSEALSRTGWLEEDRLPSADEARAILAVPARVTAFSAAAWSGAAVVFGLLNVAFANPRGLT